MQIKWFAADPGNGQRGSVKSGQVLLWDTSLSLKAVIKSISSAGFYEGDLKIKDASSHMATP